MRKKVWAGKRRENAELRHKLQNISRRIMANINLNKNKVDGRKGREWRCKPVKRREKSDEKGRYFYAAFGEEKKKCWEDVDLKGGGELFQTSFRQLMMCSNGSRRSRGRIWRPEMNVQGVVMFSLWNNLLWEALPPAGVAASSSGDQEASLVSVCCWKAKRCVCGGGLGGWGGYRGRYLCNV